jgi:SAM-dependent methyltransferase
VRNLPPGAARAALDPVVALIQAGLDLQEDLEHGGIGLGDVFASPEMTCGRRSYGLSRARSSAAYMPCDVRLGSEAYGIRVIDRLSDHYGTGYEQDRLTRGTSLIEFARTKELLQRFLPPPPARVLDVGGGPGAYASWLADLGYQVHLIDAMALHVEQATRASRGRFTAALGDARDLPQEDSSRDAVLMLGPLYHLTDRADRIVALEEGRRVLRPGGVLAAAGISRFASLLDGLVSGWLGEPTFDAIIERDLAEGQHRNPTDRAEWFTTAYFHRPDELQDEVEEAGLELDALLGVEGPGRLLQEKIEEPSVRQQVLRVAAAVEEEPTLLGASAHLLALARKPN